MLGAWAVAAPGALFLFIEPTVWQHHALLGALGIREDARWSPPPASALEGEGVVGAAAAAAREEPPAAAALGQLARYWWLDGVDAEGGLAESGDRAPAAAAVRGPWGGRGGGCEVMARSGPGILVLEKPTLETEN